MSSPSFLSVITTADNFRVTEADERLVPWTLFPSSSPGNPCTLGLLRSQILDLLRKDNKSREQDGRIPSWTFEHEAGDSDRITRVSFAAHLESPSARSSVMRELCVGWRDAGLFPDVIGPHKWRAELYAVYRNPFGRHLFAGEVGNDAAVEDELAKTCENYAFSMERTTCALFGVVTHGVHMNMFQVEGGKTSVWIPRRAKTKQTWPGMLDNSVAGGMPSGLGPWESMLKECMEEASLAEDIVRSHAYPIGAVSYFFRTAAGWLQPEVQYSYDLRVPSGLSGKEKEAFIPKPLDGEVESFELMDLEAAIAEMLAGNFKPNCGLVFIDFLIRHGRITAENEPDFLEIVTRLHGRFGYDRWIKL